MDLHRFIDKTVSPWMRETTEGNDYAISTRLRLARNFDQLTFPPLSLQNDLSTVKRYMQENFSEKAVNHYGNLGMIELEELNALQRNLLVDKHLISSNFLKRTEAAVLLSENEQLSIMVNEEDHLRVQLYDVGLQLHKTLEQVLQIDDWLEEKIDFAFEEKFGYLTSCPSNVGTGLRASVMLHLPALSHSKKMQQIISIIRQWGFAVRGFFGEGSQSLGHLYQVSNQVTLGKTEEEIINDLHRIVRMFIAKEKHEEMYLKERFSLAVENKVYRSYGILQHSRILDAKEATNRLSDIKLGINLGLIQGCSHTVINELIFMTQAGFLQTYANKQLTEKERDILRATIVRERLSLL